MRNWEDMNGWKMYMCAYIHESCKFIFIEWHWIKVFVWMCECRWQCYSVYCWVMTQFSLLPGFSYCLVKHTCASCVAAHISPFFPPIWAKDMESLKIVSTRYSRQWIGVLRGRDMWLLFAVVGNNDEECKFYI